MDDEGCSTSYGKSGWKISKGTLLMARKSMTTLYTVISVAEKSKVVFVAEEEILADLWHKRLGHLGVKDFTIC